MAIEFLETVSRGEGSCLYMALTIGSARDIIWDTLKEMNEKHGLGGIPNEANSVIVFPNKLKIKLDGADCSEKQMRKILGQKYKKVAIDEAGSFTIDMKKLVYQICLPTIIDLLGNIILLGTCEDIPLTFFEDVTEGREKGWSVHKWSSLDNPFIKVQFQKMIDDILARNPNAIYAAWFRSHYLNQWAINEDMMVMKLHEGCYLDKFVERKTPHEYILGVDLGYNDATAFSILAYHKHDKHATVVRSWKETQMDFSDVAKEIEKVQEDYPFYKIIVDGANKQGVEFMKRKFDLPLDNAEKQDKVTFLRLLRDDIITEQLKIVKNDNNKLVTEWKQLKWKDEDKDEEDPRCQNHLSDATLYAWRECRHFWVTEETKKAKRNQEEYYDKLMKEEAEKLTKKDDLEIFEDNFNDTMEDFSYDDERLVRVG